MLHYCHVTIVQEFCSKTRYAVGITFKSHDKLQTGDLIGLPLVLTGQEAILTYIGFSQDVAEFTIALHLNHN